jgi:hypothetical protein
LLNVVDQQPLDGSQRDDRDEGVQSSKTGRSTATALAVNANVLMDTVEPPEHESSTRELVSPRQKTIRIRDKAHLAFVAAQPCLVCQRSPCDAHHLKFAQPRSLGRKVSDEFAVPLCRDHHQQLHRQGNEIAWWANLQIVPIQTARQLWAATLLQADVRKTETRQPKLDPANDAETVLAKKAPWPRYDVALALPRGGIDPFSETPAFALFRTTSSEK